MRNVLTAAALLALAGSAQAGPLTLPIYRDAEAAYCLKNGGQPTFAHGKWKQCTVSDTLDPRKTIVIPARSLQDAALCSLAAGKVTMAHGDFNTCIIP